MVPTVVTFDTVLAEIALGFFVGLGWVLAHWLVGRVLK